MAENSTECMEKENKLFRSQFNFTEKQIQQLDSLVSMTGAISRVETVRRAILVYEMLIKHQGEIVLRDKDGKEKIIVLLEK